MNNETDSTITLQYLLNTADNSDFYEEEAEDFLSDKKINIPSMSRTAIYKLAWRNGWRPTKEATI
jgi:hypothetical protein